MAGLPGGDGAELAGFLHDQRVSGAPTRCVGWPVRAGVSVVLQDWLGGAGPFRCGRRVDQSYAFKHKATNYAHMIEAKTKLSCEVIEWLSQAQSEDEAKDASLAAHAAATSRRSGCATSRPGWRASASPSPSLRPRLGKLKPLDRRRLSTLTATQDHARAESYKRRPASPNQNRGATSLIRRAGASRVRTALFRLSTGRCGCRRADNRGTLSYQQQLPSGRRAGRVGDARALLSYLLISSYNMVVR